VRTLGEYTFLYLRHADIYLLSITRNNANVMMAFQFLSSVRCVAWHVGQRS
jgi:AP-2 complex subunit mu-1